MAFMAEAVFTSLFAIFEAMTSPEQPAFILDQEIKLLKDCVRSVVYHLKTDKDSLERSLTLQCRVYLDTGFITWGSRNHIKELENKLWYSVMRMKWLKGDGVTLSWLKVKKRRRGLQMDSNRSSQSGAVHPRTTGGRA